MQLRKVSLSISSIPLGNSKVVKLVQLLKAAFPITRTFFPFTTELILQFRNAKGAISCTEEGIVILPLNGSGQCISIVFFLSYTIPFIVEKAGFSFATENELNFEHLSKAPISG